MYRLILADDATGALEAGAILASGGYHAAVHLEPAPAATTEAAVLLCPVRHRKPEEAAELVRLALSPSLDNQLLYWKTDSTLRGPIGAALEELKRLYPSRPIVYSPAYPAMGRTMRQGVLSVHGVPVDVTEFADDALNPVRSAWVRDLFTMTVVEVKNAEELRFCLAAGQDGILICDAGTEPDIAALAEVCREFPEVICAGPAGGIRYWAPPHAGAVPASWPLIREWLLLCGSRHPNSVQQAARSELRTVFGADHLLAEAALRSDAGAMMIFGGDSALAVWRALGIQRLEPIGEVLPGVAVSRGGGRVFVTKAGGFGGPDLVAEIMRKWSQ